MGRNRKKRQRMIRLMGLLFMILAFMAVMLVFQVKTVVVNGNVRHSGQEIADGLSYDLLTENTLFLTWKHRTGSAPERMPYLSSLKIKLDSPGKITVTVTEKELVGYVDKEQNLYFDEEGIILEITDEVYSGIPVVTGVKMGEPVLYQKLPTDSSAQLRTILSITQLLRYQELSAEEIRFSDNMDITVRIGNVDAVLGQDEYLEEKIANLRAILNVMDGSSGTLHMENFTGKNEPVSFSESEIPGLAGGGEDETENPDEDDETGGTVDTPQGAGDGQGPDGAVTDTQDGVAGEDGQEPQGAGDGQGPDGIVTGTQDDVTGEDGQTPQDAGDGQEPQDAGDGEPGDDSDEEQNEASTVFMVFDSSGTLRYDARVVDGVVVDANGTPIDGCTVTEEGYVKDAYWNVIDPKTGQLAQ